MQSAIVDPRRRDRSFFILFVTGDFLWSGLRKKIRDLVFINLLLCLLFFLHSKLNVTDLFRAAFFFFSFLLWTGHSGGCGCGCG